jgi:hypothetical protein
MTRASIQKLIVPAAGFKDIASPAAAFATAQFTYKAG